MRRHRLDIEAKLTELARRIARSEQEMALQQRLMIEAYALIDELQQRVSDLEALYADEFVITFEPEQYIAVEAA